MTILKLKTHSCSYSLRILLSLLAPRRDDIIPALYPDVSLSMKIGAQRKAGRGQRSKPSVCTLPMVPFVHHQSLAFRARFYHAEN